MTPIEKATPTAAIPKTMNLKDTSTAAQCKRLLEALRISPLTTIQIRRDLDILMPGARVWDLRHKSGYEIDMIMIPDETMPGHDHTVALYTLVKEAVHA